MNEVTAASNVKIDVMAVDLSVTYTVAKPPNGGNKGKTQGLEHPHQEDSSWMAIQVSAHVNLKRVKTEEVNVMEHIQNDKMKCVVYQYEKRAVLVLPCNHLGICGECAITVSNCPNCRAKVDKRVPIKLA